MAPDATIVSVAEIEFRDVSFAHAGGPPILRNLSFEVGRDEMLTVIGRSGAGKTTALKLVNGLLLPSEGSVLVGGRDTRRWNPFELRRHAGYVLQEIGLFPHMTVEQNVGIVPRLAGWAPPRIRERVHELLALVGLPPPEFAARWPDELSGGQRQRAGVARALALDPAVLLMDEPFGALDPITRREMQAEFNRLQAALRKSVVIVTHDMHEALALGNRVCVIDGGRLVACETPHRLAASTDPRVQSLLGVPDGGSRPALRGGRGRP